jgi:MFS family permease
VKAVAAYRGVLAIREARVLICASAVSQVGDGLYNAPCWVMSSVRRTPLCGVGVATILRLLPYVLVGPFGGAVADRYPRRTVLVVGSLLRLAIRLALAGGGR